MRYDFVQYKHEYSAEDLEYAKNKDIFCRGIFRKGNKKIVVFPDYPKTPNQLAVLFITNRKVDKYFFDLTGKEYSEMLFALLCDYNFGASKLVQIENFNAIQGAITDYYRRKNENEGFYQEPSKSSVVYGITSLRFDLKSPPIRNCFIDIDSLIDGLGRRIGSFNKKSDLELTEVKYIYLMHDKKKDVFKIGFSKKPKYREKTLHSETPGIYIYRQWCASQEYESILKKKFNEKRVRGEWFQLDENDIVRIDKIMSKFSVTPWGNLTKGLIRMMDNWPKK